MATEKFQAWLAGYARGGENEAARAAQAYTAFFGAPAAQVGPAYATGATASVPSLGQDVGEVSRVFDNWVEVEFATSAGWKEAVAYAVEVAKLMRKSVCGKLQGKELRAEPGETADVVERRYRIGAGAALVATLAPVFAEDGTASVPPGLARIDVVKGSHCECTFAPNLTLSQAVACLRAVAIRNRRAACGIFEGERIGAMPSDSVEDVITRYRENSATKPAQPAPQNASTQCVGAETVSVAGPGCGGSSGGASVATSAAPAPKVYTVAFGGSVTLETACEKLSARAARYGATCEAKFSGKTLRAHPGDTPAAVEHRYWTRK
jgi:hypothetical protein